MSVTPLRPLPDAFGELWRLGYRALIPIIPPGAPISARSSLAKRLSAGKDERGKAPGVRGSDGAWYGFDWRSCEADEQDLARWRNMGAGVGIKLGDGLVAIDIDTYEPADAALARGELESAFGRLPMRIGQPPKSLYLCRVDGPFDHSFFEFGPVRPDGKRSRVEILGAGKQFVAYGIHPGTRRPYEWVNRLVPFDELPIVSIPALADFLSDCYAKLPEPGPIRREKDTGAPEIDQAALRGPLELVAAAVAATPNDDQFESRESYRDFGYAIKASLPDNPDQAFEIFWSWCARWLGGENVREIVEADWRRFKPPYRIGFDWLCRRAEACSGGAFTAADAMAGRWFEAPPTEPEPLFGPPPEEAAGREIKGKSDFLSYDDILARFNAATEEFLVQKFMPLVGVGMIFGESQTYKSFIAVDLALAIANGTSWGGLKTIAGPAFYVAAEGGSGVMKRIIGAQQAKGVTTASPIFLKTVAPNLGAKGSGDAAAICAAIRVHGVQPVIIVLDTVAASMGGEDENTQGLATLLMNAKRISETFGCFVLLVHHTGLGDKDRGRGWSGQRANVDFEAKTERVEEWGDGRATRLLHTKLKDDECNMALTFRMRKVEVWRMADDGELDMSASTLVVDRIDVGTVGSADAPREEGEESEAGGASGEVAGEESETDGAQEREDEGLKLLRLVWERPGESGRRYAAAAGLTQPYFLRRMRKLQHEKLVEEAAGKWIVTAKAARLLRSVEAAKPKL